MSPTIRQIVSATIAKLIAQKLAVWSISLGTMMLGVFGYFRASLAPVMSDKTGELSLLLSSLLLLSVSVTIATYFWFHPKLKPLPWGVHQDAKSGAYFCSKCFLTQKKHNPLYLSSDGKWWHCSACSCKRVNPDFKAPDQPPSPQPHAQSWMA